MRNKFKHGLLSGLLVCSEQVDGWPSTNMEPSKQQTASVVSSSSEIQSTSGRSLENQEEVHCELQPEGDEEDTVVFWLQSVGNPFGFSIYTMPPREGLL